nr:response regulator [Klugiella xanthotipulae]
MAQPLRVLVVDDDFYVANLHRQYVDDLPGFTALPPVGSLAEARVVIDAQRPDLVLLDVYLPDGSGLELLAGLSCDAFVLTAAAERATVYRALRAGALCYLVKPFVADFLAERLMAYARYRNILSSAPDLTAETIARAQRVFHAVDAAVGPAGRSATEGAVLAAVSAAGGELSAHEVARAVGVSRATAQRYLTALAASGQIHMRLRYGTTGRPEHRYAASSR